MSAPSRLVGVDEYLGAGRSLFLGLQSLLACNLFLGPVVIISATAMGVGDASELIALTFLACGIASIVQSAFFLRYPIIQGMSFATIGAVLAIGAQSGMDVVAGSVIVASLVLVAVGFLRVFSKLVKILAPPLVAGTVIIVIGVSLMPIVWNSLVQSNATTNGAYPVAAVSFIGLLVIMLAGGRLSNRFGALLRIGSVVWAIVLGTVVAALYGQVDLSPVKDAAWLAWPSLLPNGAPTFQLGPSLVMTFILLVVLVESLGSWFTVSVLADEEMSDRQLDRGVIGEALGCLLGGFTTGVPVTSYGSNAGVIAMTRVLSRWTAVGAGVICVVMALCPKLMSLIAVIPPSVVWGVFGVVTVLILTSGLQAIRPYDLNDRNTFVVGIPVLGAIGTSLLPPDLIAAMPDLFGYLCSSAIAVGAITAVVFNLVIPEAKPAHPGEHVLDESPVATPPTVPPTAPPAPAV